MYSEAYKELNSELLRDIPSLYLDRARFLTPIYATVPPRPLFTIDVFLFDASPSYELTCMRGGCGSVQQVL